MHNAREVLYIAPINNEEVCEEETLDSQVIFYIIVLRSWIILQ